MHEMRLRKIYERLKKTSQVHQKMPKTYKHKANSESFNLNSDTIFWKLWPYKWESCDSVVLY